jgi:uncharacterized repeat protein (TIGR01451 family)
MAALQSNGGHPTAIDTIRIFWCGNGAEQKRPIGVMKRNEVASNWRKSRTGSCGVHLIIILAAAVWGWPPSSAQAAEPPRITGFSPEAGPVATPVTIEGEHLEGATAVLFNNIEAQFVVGFLGMSLVATVPAGAASGPITVITDDGTDTTAQSFSVTVNPAPGITGFSPVSGAVGQSVAISGTNFEGATAVLFNGVEAEFTIFANALSALVPQGAATGPITVVTPGGSATSDSIFTVTTAGAPVITSFSPDRGRPGARINILGANLELATAVRFNGVAAEFDVFGTSIFADVPAEATSGPITIITAAGVAQSAQPFTVLGQFVPEITRFEPGTGTAGTSVTIRGTNFIGVTEVSFGGIPAEFTTLSESELRAIVPPDAVSGPISVVAPSGVATSGTNFLLPAQLSEFEPAHGPAGTEITIRGMNLLGVIEVLIAESSASFAVVSATEIRAVVPEGAVSGAISVATPAGFAISRSNFLLPPGNVTFSPGSGLPGTVVSITGENLLGATGVDFAGVPAEFSPISLTAMTATVPEGAVSGPITVTTPAGAASSASNFLSGHFSDLSVEVSASAAEVEVGDFLSYTIRVMNHGPLDATGVVVTNWLPDGVRLIFLPSEVESVESDNVLICKVGALTSGFGINIQVLAIVTGDTHLTNRVSVTSDILDPDLLNNSVSLVTPMQGVPPPPPDEEFAISVSITGGVIELTWDAAATGFFLEWTPALRSESWSLVESTPELADGKNRVQLDALPGTWFYRLRKP